MDLDHLAQWCVRNGTKLNIDKCHLIIFSRNPIQHVYNVGGRPLGVVSQIRDLGVILDKKLSYESIYLYQNISDVGFYKEIYQGFSQSFFY